MEHRRRRLRLGLERYQEGAADMGDHLGNPVPGHLVGRKPRAGAGSGLPPHLGAAEAVMGDEAGGGLDGPAADLAGSDHSPPRAALEAGNRLAAGRPRQDLGKPPASASTLTTWAG